MEWETNFEFVQTETGEDFSHETMTCLGGNTVRAIKKELWYLCHRCVLQVMSEKTNEERDKKENKVLKRSPKQILKS